MKNRIRRSTVAFIMAAMIVAAGLGGCGQVEETEIPTEETVQEEVTEEAVTEEATESSEQEETSEVQEESEESEAQNYDENEAEKIDWAAIWPDISQASPISPVEHLKDADICIEGYWDSLELKEDIAYAGYSYQNVFMNDEGRKAFPKLAEAIDKYNLGAGSSKDSFFSECSENYNKTISFQDNAYEDRKKICLTRVDDQVFSFIETEGIVIGDTQGYYKYKGVNLDTNTGKDIKLSDVIVDEKKFIEIIYKKLNEKYSDIRANEDVSYTVYDYIMGERKDALCWAMLPYGITVFFNPYSFGSYDMGVKEITVTYLDNPELFTDKYTADTGSWAVTLPEAYIDINGDGKSDHIYWENDYDFADSDEYSFITGINIFVNDKEYSFDYTDYESNSCVYSTFIKNGNDYYIYIYTSQESDAVATYIYKISGSGVTYVGETGGAVSINVNDYYDDPYNSLDLYRIGVLYNPERFYLSHTLFIIQVTSGIKTVKIGTDGMVNEIDEYYAIPEMYSKKITSKTEFTAKEVDEEGNVGEEKSFPAGVIFKIFRSDYETFADCVLEDGSLFRLELEKNNPDWDWPDMTNGKDLDEVFEAESLW